MTPKPSPNGTLVFRLLSAHPHPAASGLRLNVQGVCRFTIDGAEWCFDDRWYVGDETIAHHLPAAERVNAGLLHAEIGRVRMLADPAASWESVKADCVGPDLPADDPLYDRATAAQALAKVTAERDDLERRLAAIKSDRHEETLRSADERDALRAEVKRITDAHAVVSQRLVGSQKEVAEQGTTIEELRGALEAIASNVGLVGSDRWAAEEIKVKVAEVVACVKRLRKSINTAHAVLDEAAIGLEPEGSPRWTLARRCRTLAAEIWDHLDAVNALDEIAKVVGLIPPSLSSGATDGEVVARVKALHQDDDLRSAIAVAVGLDGSASLGLILDTVNRDRPAREISRLSGLLDVLAAPVAFGGRRLSTAERAEWALRRALRERDECAPRMAQLIDAEVLLDTLGVPAYAAVPSDDPGDASEALTIAERLRLHFAAQS